MLIERPPQLYRIFFKGALFRIPSGKNPGKVYLTFDDGPIPESTPWILDVLDQHNVKATFFMVGQNVERYPELFQQTVARGHRPGNHTLHHIRGLSLSVGDYIKDAEEGAKLTGSNLMRPPHGYLTPAQFKALRSRYKVVMMDVLTRDYSKNVDAKGIVKNVKNYVRDGSIIVFHDSLKSIEKLKIALPEAIRWLQSQGYEFGVL